MPLPPRDSDPAARRRRALIAAVLALALWRPAPRGGRRPVASAGRHAGRHARPGPRRPAATPASFPGWPKPGQVTTSGIIPVLASSEKLVGQSRLLFVLVDDQNRPIADETLEVEIGFFDLCADPATATEVLTPSFEWGIVGQRAFYVVTPELTQPGPWGAAIAVRDPATGHDHGRQAPVHGVRAGGFGPRVGDPAPAVKTPTLADVGGDVRKISTDPNPDPGVLRDLARRGPRRRSEPFLLAFVTPAFCKSAQCGPTLDVVKAAVKAAPIRVVAVEPYQLVYQDGRLQPVYEDGSFVPVEAANVYGIPTEPWIFVVDADGVIASSFEAVVGEQELVDAIRAVTK